jgi:hypothetical protein
MDEKEIVVEKTPHQAAMVRIVGVEISIGDMTTLLVKLVIASIPASIILCVIAACIISVLALLAGPFR